MLLAAASASCAPAETRYPDDSASGKDALLEDMIFLRGQDALVTRAMPVAPESVDLCLGDELRGKYRAGAIAFVAGWTPFSLNPLSKRCQARIDTVRPATSGWNLVRETGKCQFFIRVTKERVEESWTYVRGHEPGEYMNCTYRIALFYQGFNGALEMADERLFEATRDTALIGWEAAVGDFVPVLIWRLKMCAFSVPSSISRTSFTDSSICRQISRNAR